MIRILQLNQQKTTYICELDDIEESYNMNLNILIDALRQADMINDDVIDFIQEKLEEIDKEEEENE